MTLPHLSRFLHCFADALDRQDQPVAAAHAKRLRTLQAGLTTLQNVPVARVPVQTQCEAELQAYVGDNALAKALSDLMPALHLTRSKTYLAAPPSANFADNYGYSVICGPDSGPPALMKDAEISFGLMLLGPDTHYPLHSHPADEIYYTVTGPSSWRTGDDAWSSRTTGEIIHHPSWITHATLAGDSPLVLLYVWQGDLETDAAFTPDRMAAAPTLNTQGAKRT
ncbi:dimethylsulfonioproprionate lyase family protein [Pseudomonas sp. NPDC089569]|uniref:dimethylsulfonioproprionate lyase family protein n=1 Tax=Pseudomonas sp. NPDC089569 TaxID=3390722 RepID=UPI003D094CAE